MSTKFESFTPTTDDFWQSYGTRFQFQTFTPSSSHNITSVKLKLHRIGSPTGNFIVEIYATSGGNPTGSALANGTKDSSTISTSATVYEITLGAGYNLSASTQYAIVTSQAGASGSDSIGWEDASSGGYTGGLAGETLDGGSSWSTHNSGNADFYFEEWGDLTDVNINPPVSSITITAPIPTLTFEAGEIDISVPLISITITAPVPTIDILSRWVFPTKSSSTAQQPTKHTSSWVIKPI